ncbi:MAG: DNA topoisomerase IB, partial [Solirubrobacterales bacterium]
VNAYIQAKIGEGFSAKDFRTWHGTVLAAVELAGEPEPGSEAAAKRSVKAAIARVAEALGNTPAVCRRSYVDPRVVERFRDGETISPKAAVGGRMSAKARAKLEREVRALVA